MARQARNSNSKREENITQVTSGMEAYNSELILA